MKESDVVKDRRKVVKALGGLWFKWTSPGVRAVMDSFELYPIPAAHQETVARYIKFVELKRPGKKPTVVQERRANEIRALGFEVICINKKEELLC